MAASTALQSSPVAIPKVTRHTPYPDLPEKLRIREVAAYLGVSRGLIDNALHEGRISFQMMGKKLRLIPKEELHPSRALKLVKLVQP